MPGGSNDPAGRFTVPGPSQPVTVDTAPPRTPEGAGSRRGPKVHLVKAYPVAVIWHGVRAEDDMADKHQSWCTRQNQKAAPSGTSWSSFLSGHNPAVPWHVDPVGELSSTGSPDEVEHTDQKIPHLWIARKGLRLSRMVPSVPGRQAGVRMRPSRSTGRSQALVNAEWNRPRSGKTASPERVDHEDQLR